MRFRRQLDDLPELVNFHFHDLRHTFASWMRLKGVELDELKEILGHRSISMTMRYAHIKPETKDKAISRLDDDVLINNVQ
jgi:integrase